MEAGLRRLKRSKEPISAMGVAKNTPDDLLDRLPEVYPTLTFYTDCTHLAIMTDPVSNKGLPQENSDTSSPARISDAEWARMRPILDQQYEAEASARARLRPISQAAYLAEVFGTADDDSRDSVGEAAAERPGTLAEALHILETQHGLGLRGTMLKPFGIDAKGEALRGTSFVISNQR